MARIHAELEQTPVLFITGTPAAFSAGLNARVFEKPLNLPQIARALRDFVGAV